MGELFLNPWFLAGAGGAAVPLIIHLLVRRRFRRQPWAAMDLLLRAFKKTRRRLRLENLIVLLLRMAALVLLAVALARPVVHSPAVAGSVGEKSRAVFLLLDNSYSMSFKRGRQTPFEGAKKAAAELLDSLKPGSDSAALLLVSDLPQVLFGEPTPEIEKVKEALGEAEPGFGASSLGAGLDRLLEILSRSPASAAVHREVWFLTDGQKRAWISPEDAGTPAVTRQLAELAPKVAAFTVVETGEDSTDNAAILDLAGEDAVVGVEKPAAFTVRVANSGPSPQDLPVEFLVDGNAVASSHLALPPGETGTARFHAVFHSAGSHTVAARIGADSLAADNERFRALDVKGQIRVLLVDGEPATEGSGGLFSGETAHLALALLPVEEAGAQGGLSILRPEVVRHFELTPAVLAREWDLIVLANEGRTLPMDGALLDALARAVRGGGALLVFLGDKVRAEDYNERLWQEGRGLLPLKLTRVLGDANEPVALDPRSRRHPAFSVFEDPAYHEWLVLPQTAYWFGMEVPDPLPEGVAVAAWFGKDPAVVEKTVDRGRVMVVATSADVEWTDLPKNPVYLPLVHEIIYYLVRDEGKRRNLRLGEALEWFLSRGQYSEDVSVVLPSGGRAALEPPRELPDGHFQVTFGPVAEPGLFELQVRKGAGGDAPSVREAFCANVDATEGDLAKASGELLEAVVPPELRKKFSRAGEGASRPSAAPEEGSELWRVLLTALAAVLVLESFLAQRFGDYGR
ncbi:MAG: BatA domain-containing protein [Planctomycetes bacterium]|jgi:hypothetical protein|nr:BatA domain-containing protein [Planctomycetota bacterium]